MRLFHAQILDEHLEGGSSVQIAEPWACFLARAEMLKFTCIADQVSGTPTLTLLLFGGPAQYINEDTKTLLNAIPLVSGTNLFSATYSPQDATYPPLRHLYLEADMGGTAPKAHIQLWVCGRGPQLLEAIPPVSASFAAQYAAAKMLEDEDCLPQKKRVLRQGASLFYPPELFLPSLKWER